jgi:pre-mRNA-splicing factor 38A
MKIYSSMYWKEHCFALTAESLVDKAVELKFVGGTFGGQVNLIIIAFSDT